MDSTIIRIPRVADASVTLEVNRSRQQKPRPPEPQPGGNRRQPPAETGARDGAAKQAAYAEPIISPEVIGRLISDFGEPGSELPPATHSATPAGDRADQESRAREEIRQEAYREGFASGFEDGRQEFSGQCEKITALIASLGEIRDQLLSEVEDDVVAVVFQAVATIVGSAVAERTAIADIVTQVVGQVRDRENLVVRVSHKDYELIRSAYAQQGPEGRRVEVVAEPRILPGGCLVESSAGTLDGRLEVQLQSLRELLQGVRSGAGNA